MKSLLKTSILLVAIAFCFAFKTPPPTGHFKLDPDTGNLLFPYQRLTDPSDPNFNWVCMRPPYIKYCEQMYTIDSNGNPIAPYGDKNRGTLYVEED